ncbi:MAG: RimK/LysX family protein [Gammaproteobacteria bacterium]
MSMKSLEKYVLSRNVGSGSCLVFLMLMFMPVPGVTADTETRIVGWIEKVALEEGLTVHAKIDTGAKHSSLNMGKHEFFKLKGKPWIRFTMTNREGKAITMERQIVRYAKVKRKGSRSQVRPVVKLAYCLDTVSKTVQVTLTDRSNFDYQMLVGRSFLRNDFLVDSSKKYTTEPQCATKQQLVPITP